ncbi:MAG: pilus assembly protein [Burkholderiales bacterium]|nr:pilus assembly protein [Burkholderiales bacterium]MDE2394802.1 pilus assembly protein [Burkholderiales bacterium]MDE2452753.1 pilus assembly protein [Burkholderiales bacterium]
MRPDAAARHQAGTAAVEFALVSAVFFTALLGVVEMGRMLWLWNAAVEATRLGARLAVVCDLNDADIKTRMMQRLPDLTSAEITVTYLNPPAADNTCTAATCKAVSVQLSGYVHQTLIPFVSLSVSMPSFMTTLPKEFMNSTNNPACQ